MPSESIETFLGAHPEIRSVRAAAVDLNGVARGKRLPAQSASKLSALRFPFSALNLDVWGADIEGSPLVFETGDQDGVLRPTERGAMPLPWLDVPGALQPIWMFHEDGTPFAGDPRHALSAVAARYRAKGLTPVVATEMEFFLVTAPSHGDVQPAISPAGRPSDAADTLSIETLDRMDGFWSDLYAACQAMGIPAEAATSEAAPGQFEVNLRHVADPLRAADDAWLFKLAARGVAHRHGLAASFMAKPFAKVSGTGLHVHFSVLDDDGRNIFDDGGPEGTEALRHAIGGCLADLQDSTLIFAPHANSYDRLVPGAHAPTGICWAYENRTALVRVPGGPPVARRIEHRAAGGDVNPYLMLAVVLGSALNGMQAQTVPPDPISGNAYALDLPLVATSWGEAVDRFDASAAMRRILPEPLIRNFVMTKRQEMRRIAGMSSQEQLALYLETV